MRISKVFTNVWSSGIPSESVILSISFSSYIFASKYYVQRTLMYLRNIRFSRFFKFYLSFGPKYLWVHRWAGLKSPLGRGMSSGPSKTKTLSVSQYKRLPWSCSITWYKYSRACAVTLAMAMSWVGFYLCFIQGNVFFPSILWCTGPCHSQLRCEKDSLKLLVLTLETYWYMKKKNRSVQLGTFIFPYFKHLK